MSNNWESSQQVRQRVEKRRKKLYVTNLHSANNTLLRNTTTWTFTHRAAHCSGTPRHEPSLIEQHIAQEHHDMNLHSSSNTRSGTPHMAWIGTSFKTNLTSIKMAYTLHVIHSPPPQFQQIYHIANSMYNNNFKHTFSLKWTKSI